MSLKIIFAGTPAFAATALSALLASSHQILAVYTQPDKPQGRGLKVLPSPVKVLALQQQIPVHQPTTLKTQDEQEKLRAWQADVMVVAAYGMLLPAAVLSIPRAGCINIHPSLLPRWRGAAPIQRTIYAGDTETGVTIMQMDVGLDTGPMLKQSYQQLKGDETSQSLHDTLALDGARLLITTLSELENQALTPVVQDNTQACYAQKLSKTEALIDWELSAVELSRRIRAFNPWPVAYTFLAQERLRIWDAIAIPEGITAPPGSVVAYSAAGIDVATGDGVLRLTCLQSAGGNKQSADIFSRAKQQQLVAGMLFGKG